MLLRCCRALVAVVDLPFKLVVGVRVQTLNDTDYTLNNDIDFYCRFTFKVCGMLVAVGVSTLFDGAGCFVCWWIQPLWAYSQHVCKTYSVPWVLSSVYYPWNRTFEIGLLAEMTDVI